MKWVAYVQTNERLKMFKTWLKNIAHLPVKIALYFKRRMVAITLSKRNHRNSMTSGSVRLKNLYTHCHQISLSIFIQCLIHSNFAGLVSHGNPPQRQRAQAWDLLYMEYCDLSGSVGHKKILSLGREVGMLESKLLTIRTCVLVLSIRYSQKMVDLLHKNGYHYDLDPQSGQKYIDELQMIVRKSKAISISIEQKRYEYNQEMKKYEGEKWTEQYFDDLLVELSRFMSFRLHPNDITVTEFVAIQNRFTRECEMTQREAERMKQKTSKIGRR